MQEIRWTYSYDTEGRLASLQSPGQNDCQFFYEFHHNKRVSLIRRKFSDGSEMRQEFDRLGRRTLLELREKDEGPPTRNLYEYDGLSRIVGAEREDARIALAYDTKSRITSIEVNNQFKVEYSFDFLGRLAKIETPLGEIVYEYQTGQGETIRRMPNGVWTLWETAPDGSLAAITHVDSDNHILLKIEYEYLPDGSLLKMKEWYPEGEKTATFGYDTAQRMVSVLDSEGSKTEFTYDDFGNRTSISVNGSMIEFCAYDWLGRLLNRNGRDCAHDAEGNLSLYSENGEERCFEFNMLGLLAKAVMPDGEVTYRYDGDGNLIGRAFSNGNETRFLSNPLSDVWRPLMAEEKAGGGKTFYVWEGDIPLVVIENGRPCFLLHDHLGSARLVVDGEGKLLSSHSYNPFGISSSPLPGNSLAPGFAGLFHDSLAALTVTRGRTYVPDMGRFLQMDPQHRIPMGAQEDLSPYAYCGCNPVNRIDRDGLRSQSAWENQNSTPQLLPGVLNSIDNFSKYCALQAETAITSTQGGWGGAASQGMQATGWDLLGGLICREPQSMNQAYAQVMWSLTPGISAVKSTYDKVISFAEGNINSLGGPNQALSIFSSGAEHLGNGTYTLPSGQLEFNFAKPANLLHVNSFNNIAKIKTGVEQWSGVLEHFGNAIQVWSAGMKDWPSLTSSADQAASAHLPTHVGGIYLRGACNSLEGTGSLRGIAMDQENGRLILLSQGQGEIALPPLRLDDVVTIFRSVYEKGEAPFVSIDPNPDDPDGPLMLARHGELTRDSYVGWVMFESDRVMKTYSLGLDNITGQPVQSAIDGYQSLLDVDASSAETLGQEKVWERFWIVPARVTRRESQGEELTLFDVPLRVMTQRMVFQNGKLVPATNDSPSPQARAFAEWFTHNYDRLSDEALSLPPEECGIKEPVSFFHELRRVALITAIAERLCQQGVEMPHWMKDYPVTSCQLAETTPAITVTRTGTEVIQKKKWWGGASNEPMEITRQIHGGVNLAPDDSSIISITGDTEADCLSGEVRKMAATFPLFSATTFEIDEKQYQAAALPGCSTRALGAFVLPEVDLIVPIQNIGAIRLERFFHSFFRPQGDLGAGWTLDLPHLEKYKRPTRRTGEVAEFMTVFSLYTPLNTINARFDTIRFVPELNGEMMVARSEQSILGLTHGHDERIGAETDQVFLRDGQQWHFYESGHLAAKIQAPLATIYRRDADCDHRIMRIEGWYGNEQRSCINLEYDEHGRIRKASSSVGQEVFYSYNPEGELMSVTGPDEELAYGYDNGCLTSIGKDGNVERLITCNNQGQVLKEWRKETGEIHYQIQTDENGYLVSTSLSDAGLPLEEMEYDQSFRPIRKLMPDGTQVRWRHNGGDDVEITVSGSASDEISLQESSSGQRRKFQLPEGVIIETSQDQAGRMTSFEFEGETIVRLAWHHNGQPDIVQDSSTAWRSEYRRNGTLNRLLITPPGDKTSFNRWLGCEADELGRITHITDSTGFDGTISHDTVGRPSACSTNRGKIVIGRDNEGRAVSIETSWGLLQKTEFDTAGQVARTEVRQNGNSASIEYDHGQPARIQQFDGGETHIAYHKLGAPTPLINVITTPPGLQLSYEHDPDGRISTVTCGKALVLAYEYDSEGRLAGLRKTQA